MDLSKSYEFFAPDDCTKPIHIIGCGSVGATIAECLVRFGLTKFYLYDFDIVEPHNLGNQMFTSEHIGKLKVDCTLDIMAKINSDVVAKTKLYPEGYKNQRLNGYVFLCVDNIDLRREIATAQKTNPYIEAMFDFRTRLTDAQHFAADWHNPKAIESFLATMNFSHAEAEAETPRSACNVTLSVTPTVRMICSAGVSNFVNFVKDGAGALKKMILLDAFNFIIDAC